MKTVVNVKCSHYMEDDLGDVSNEFSIEEPFSVEVDSGLVKESYDEQSLSDLLEAIVKNKKFLDNLLKKLEKSVTVRDYTTVFIDSINDGSQEIDREAINDEYGLQSGEESMCFYPPGEWNLESRCF